MNPFTQIPLNEELVPVREAQKNITKYFERGLTRITKNGRSLGYLISDKRFYELIDEIKEKLEESNPAFIAEMEAEEKDKNLISLQDMMKKYGLTKKR